jgi:hypothetical protein
MIPNLPIKVRKEFCFPGDDFDVILRLWLLISFFFSVSVICVFLLAHFVVSGFQSCFHPSFVLLV